jgi:hypothetical protein
MTDKNQPLPAQQSNHHDPYYADIGWSILSQSGSALCPDAVAAERPQEKLLLAVDFLFLV